MRQKINKEYPMLNVSFGDVRKLEFDDEFFSGYWSLGVIEHFWSGYGEIANEMYRVLKKNGILFLTVPVISPLRRLKTKLKMYPLFTNENELPADFYQFAFAIEKVISDFEKYGFRLIEKQGYDGVKGLKDEVCFVNKTLQDCYDSKTVVNRVIIKALNVFFSNLTQHLNLFVFKKI